MTKDYLLNLLCRVYVQEISADEAFDELEDLIERTEREEYVTELEDRIKRLEDAGDGLLELCEAEVNQHHLADEIDARCKSWREAKDAKP